MPLDEVVGEGCIKLLFRFLFEVFFEWFWHAFWTCCQYLGAFVVWLLTFGRVWLLDENENLAGLVGLLVVIAVSVWLYWVSLT